MRERILPVMRYLFGNRSLVVLSTSRPFAKTAGRWVRLVVASLCLTAPVGGEGKVAMEQGHSLSRLAWIILLVLVVALESIGLSIRNIVDFITAAIVDAMGRGGVG